MTLTEKTALALIGKTFTHFYEGKVIARGILLGMVGPSHIQLAVEGRGGRGGVVRDSRA